MNKMTNATSQLLALGILTGASTAVMASTPPSTAITPGPEKAEIELQILYQSEDSVRPNRYLGPVHDGEEVSINAEVVQKDSQKDNRYSHFVVKGAGTHHPYYRARVGEQGNFSLMVEYRERPKYQYLGLNAPYLTGNNLVLPELQAGQALSDQMNSFNIEHKRSITRLSGQKVFDPQWRLNLVVNREDKSGNDLQGFGAWMDRSGFQMPAPINQRTDLVGVTLEYFTPKLQGRVGYNISQFRQLDDNLFYAQDPHNGNTKLLSRAPENNFYQFNGSMAYFLSQDTKISTELDLARAQQDDELVHDVSFNDVLASIDATSLNAKIDTTRFGVRATHRLNSDIMLRANYRFDDRDNKTKVYSNLKSEYSKMRDTRAHDLTRHTADLDANMRLFGNSTWLVGAKFENTDRKTADRSDTQEATVHTRLRTRWGSKLTTGVKGQYSTRTGSTYDDTITSNNEAMRKYFLASVDRTQAAIDAHWSALSSLALGIEVTYKEDDYTKSELGLTNDNRLATTLTADYFPSNRLSGTVFFTYEDGDRKQAGIAENLSHNTTTITYGLSGNSQLTADGKWNLGTNLVVMQSDIDIKASSANSYPTLKSDLTEWRLYGDYKANDKLTYKLSYLIQDYKESDWALGYGIVPNATNSNDYWLMGAANYKETVHIIVGSVAYQF